MQRTCVGNYTGVAVLFVLQLQKFTELSAIFLDDCCQVGKLVQDPQVLQEEAERVAALVPVVGAVIAAQTGQHAHRCVRILRVIQVGSVRGTLLQNDIWM